MNINIDIGIESSNIGLGALAVNHASINKSESTTVTVTVTLFTPAPVGGRIINIDLSGIQTQVEISGNTATPNRTDGLGAGKDCTVTGGTVTWLGYRRSQVAVSFAEGETTKDITIAMVANKILERPRIVTISGFGAVNFTIVDDRITEIIDVSDYGFHTDGITSNDDHLTTIIEYITTAWGSAPNNNYLIYFPDGTYAFKNNDLTSLLPSSETNARVGIEGESRTGTILKRLGDTFIGAANLSVEVVTDKIIVTKTGHGLTGDGTKNNSAIVFFGDVINQSDSNWDYLEQFSWYVNLIDENSFYLHWAADYVGVDPAWPEYVLGLAEDILTKQHSETTLSDVSLFADAQGNGYSRMFKWIIPATNTTGCNMLSWQKFTLDGNYWHDPYATGLTDRIAPSGAVELEQNSNWVFGYNTGTTGNTGELTHCFQDISINNTQGFGLHPLGGTDIDVYHVSMDYSIRGGIALNSYTAAPTYVQAKCRLDDVVASNSHENDYHYFCDGGSNGLSIHFENILGGATVYGDSIDFVEFSVYLNNHNLDSVVNITNIAGKLTNLVAAPAASEISSDISLAPGTRGDIYVNNTVGSMSVQYDASVLLADAYFNGMGGTTNLISFKGGTFELSNCRFTVDDSNSLYHGAYLATPRAQHVTYDSGGSLKFTDCEYAVDASFDKGENRIGVFAAETLSENLAIEFSGDTYSRLRDGVPMFDAFWIRPDTITPYGFVQTYKDLVIVEPSFLQGGYSTGYIPTLNFNNLTVQETCLKFFDDWKMVYVNTNQVNINITNGCRINLASGNDCALDVLIGIWFAGNVTMSGNRDIYGDIAINRTVGGKKQPSGFVGDVYHLEGGGTYTCGTSHISWDSNTDELPSPIGAWEI